MVSLGVTPLDGVFGAVMDWIPTHACSIVAVLAMVQAAIIGALTAKLKALRNTLEVRDSMLVLARKKNETLNNLLIRAGQEVDRIEKEIKQCSSS